jgi:selenide,water dikinase
MLVSNQAAASLIDEFDVSAVTDITGFGLAGHALQLAGVRGPRSEVRGQASGITIREPANGGEGASFSACGFAIDLAIDAIPLLPGAVELFSSGVESTLAPANRAAEAEIESMEAQRRTPQYAALFDPQTSGGLLIAVAERDTDEVLRRLAEQSDIPAAAIGRVTAASTTCPIRLIDSISSPHPELCSR